MNESTHAPQAATEDEDWDIEAILDDAGIGDGAEVDGQPDQHDEPPPEEDPAQDADEAPADAESDVESASEDGSAAEEAAPGAEASNAPDQTPDDTQPRPFTFAVDGEQVEPEGAFIVPQDGEEMLVMPLRVFRDQLRPKYLGSRDAFRRTLRAKDLELADLQQTRSAAEEQAQTLLTRLEELLEDRGAMTEFLTNFETDAPRLRAEAKAAGLAAENEALRRGKMSPEERIREEEAEVHQQYTGLAHWVEELAAEDFPDLPPESLQTVYKALTDPDIFDLAFRVSDVDDPEAGLRKGKPAVYLPVVRQFLAQEASAVQRLKTTTGRVAETVRSNGARVNGGNRKAIPPTGRADGSPPPSAPSTEGPRNKQEWLASLERDD